jgi:ADP-ribosylglycohydrolase
MKYRLAGAILGDIAGSSYEFHNTKDINKINIYSNINHFTDDTVCTIAIADALLNPIGENQYPFSEKLKEWCRKYPDCGYGSNFRTWFQEDNFYINSSWGNGSAMRVSPIGYFAKDIIECRILAQHSCMNSHAHFEGIRGAQAIAESIFDVNNFANPQIPIEKVLFNYYPKWYNKYADLDTLIVDSNDILEDIRKDYRFEVSCQESVPVAIFAFLASESYEDCIKKAISMGGDSDTLAAMAGSIAYTYFKEMSKESIQFFEDKLPDDMMEVVEKFDKLIDGRNKNR